MQEWQDQNGKPNRLEVFLPFTCEERHQINDGIVPLRPAMELMVTPSSPACDTTVANVHIQLAAEAGPRKYDFH